MFAIYGFGNSTSYTQSNRLYNVFPNEDQNYVYIQLPPASLQGTTPTAIKNEIRAKYLDSTNQLAFRLTVNMPKGMEPLTMYAGYDDYGLCTNSTASNPVIYIRLRQVNGKGALANSSVQFLINNLPAQAFPTYDLSEDTGLEAFFDLIIGSLGSIAGAFQNAEGQVRSIGGGSTVSLDKSFIRLCAPGFFKYGGGHRVKRVLLKDNWNAMSGQYTSQYGQDYDYTTNKVVNGVTTTISSGVASYEPGIGSEENPFREILQFKDKLPLASAQYGAIEMPILEGLYPSPVVGYSKVTVRSIHRNGTHHDSAVRSAIGKQVTEFYTAKDYPSFSAYTPMSNIDYHSSKPFSFLYKETIDRRTTSQGFLVETNDMHGKMKAQTVYSEGDEKTPLSFTYHTYKNTGANGLNDKVDFVHNDQGGAVVSGSMGIDAELMTDVREFDVTTKGNSGQVQVDFFSFIPPVFSVIPFMLQSYTENKYRAVTTTKLINFHAIEDSVVVNDKGSVVSTQNLAYDAETGNVLVTRTNNEFNQPVYNTTYPAWWAYSGMAPAYKYIGMTYQISINNGKIITPGFDQSIFESGDELYLTYPGDLPQDNCAKKLGGNAANLIWVYDKNKTQESLTTIPDFVFLDADGNLYNRDNIKFRIVRSGKRNLLNASVASITSFSNPVMASGNTYKLSVTGSSKVVNASAAEYKEKWPVDVSYIQKTKSVLNGGNCSYQDVVYCEDSYPVNPYRKGLMGNFKSSRSLVFYGNRVETDPAITTSISRNGFIDNFKLYWDFNASNKLLPDAANTKWVWNNQLTLSNEKGMELETKDALNIYSSAQYGYAKNLPITLTRNARYSQAFDESFEDYNFIENINKVTQSACDNNRYISFAGLSNGSITAADSLNITAHTGRYVIKTNPQSSVSKVIPVIGPYNGGALYFGSATPATIVSLTAPGYNVKESNQNSIYCPDIMSGLQVQGGKFKNEKPNDEDKLYTKANDIFSFQIAHTANNVYVSSGAYYYSGYSIPVTQYFIVPQAGVYTVEIGVSTSNLQNNANPQIEGGSEVLFRNLSNNTDYHTIQTLDTVISQDPAYTGFTVVTAHRYKYCLPQGTYLLSVQCARPESICTCCSAAYNPCSTPPALNLSDHYWIQFKDLPSGTVITGYSDPTQVQQTSNCSYTTPIMGMGGLVNPAFGFYRSTYNLNPPERMQFSTWVREDCGNTPGTPCSVTSYTHSSVTIRFTKDTKDQYGNPLYLLSDTFIPSGPIIDGWQKIEGSFVVPFDAHATGELLLNNTGPQNVYFDDIRLHPFNANMKSYVYDPRTLRLSAELDENNYATFYDYDEEGQLIRVKKETVQGIKTIQETRSAKQKGITTIQ